MGKWTQKASSGNGGGDFESCPAGNHPAVLIGLIYLGTQDEVKFQSNEREMVHKVMFVWEIPDEKKANGTPHTIGRDFRLSFHEKSAMRQLIEKWRGKGFGESEEFDIDRLLGQPCLLSVVQKPSKSNPDRSYAKVDGVGQLPKGMAKPKAINKPVSWVIEPGAKLPEMEWLPFLYGEPLKDVIARSQEWKDGYDEGSGKAEEDEVEVTPDGQAAQDDTPF